MKTLQQRRQLPSLIRLYKCLYDPEVPYSSKLLEFEEYYVQFTCAQHKVRTSSAQFGVYTSILLFSQQTRQCVAPIVKEL